VIHINREGGIKGRMISGVLLNCRCYETKACSMMEEIWMAKSFGKDVGWVVFATDAVDLYLLC
jgi:hypothetical protein